MMHEKPFSQYPLTAHAGGQCAKTIRGKRFSFGTDPKEAEARYYRQKDDLENGRTSVPERDITLEDGVNHFCADAKATVRTTGLSALPLQVYIDIGKHVVDYLGRTSDPTRGRVQQFADFRNAVVEKYAPGQGGKTVTVTNVMARVIAETATRAFARRLRGAEAVAGGYACPHSAVLPGGRAHDPRSRSPPRCG